MVKIENYGLRHVQVPNNMCKTHELEPFDLYIYATIKRFMNGETREAYPSLATLRRVTGCGQERITRSIGRLAGKYFGVYYRGRKRVFVFARKYRGFEPFSYEFLDKGDLTPMEKAYIIAAQQFMFKDLGDYGKMSFSARDLSGLINMPEWEIRRHDRSLVRKGYLSIVQTGGRDFETGLPMREKLFNLGRLGQKLIWLLAVGTEKIRRNNERIDRLRKDLQVMKRVVARQGEEISRLRKPIDVELRVEL